MWLCFVYLTDFHSTAPAATFNLRKVELTPLEQRKLTFDSHTMVTELESCGELTVLQLYGRGVNFYHVVAERQPFVLLSFVVVVVSFFNGRF